MLLFSIVLYLSAKIPIVALRRATRSRGSVRTGGEQALVPAATALTAAFAGLAVGMFFLSFSYHYVLWIYIGLSGALYSAVRRHDASFVVRFGSLDAAIVAGTDISVVAVVGAYTRHKLG